MNILKRIYVSVAVGLCCAIVIGMVQFDKRCDALRDNCLRMHVLANSNSNFDQQLKLKVRDEVLTLSQDIFYRRRNLRAGNCGSRRQFRAYCPKSNAGLRPKRHRLHRKM